MRATLDRKVEVAAEKRRYLMESVGATSRRQPATANDPTTTAIDADEVLGTHKWRARASGVLLGRYRYPRAARSPALERIPQRLLPSQARF